MAGFDSTLCGGFYVAANILTFHILPMPDHTQIYVIAMVILSSATMVFLEYCDRRFKLFGLAERRKSN